MSYPENDLIDRCGKLIKDKNCVKIQCGRFAVLFGQKVLNNELV